MTRSQMQAAFSLIFVFALIALPTGALAEADPAASASLNATAPASTPDSELRSELDQLKELVREQQRRIEALESERGSVAGPPVNATALSPSSSSIGALPAQNATAPTSQTSPGSTSQPPSQTLSTNQNYQNAGSSDERIRNLERQIKGLGPISFSGDIRLRGEPFFGGPTDESLDRVRERVRARFNAVADLGSQFRAGISLASGDINDPTSTNQTLTGFYARKTIALDQAFVEYKPKQLKFLDLVGGKFRYPWYNTELTWDKDLNPEGVAETFAFDVHTPVLKRLAVVAFQLPFAEVADTSVNDKRIGQQITYGGQVQTAWQLIPRVRLSAYSGFYWFDGSDSIAVALARASAKNPQTPLTGLLPLGTGNTVQNAIFTTTATNVVTIGGARFPTGVTNITNAQYASQYALFDSIARFDIDTGHPKFPVTLIGDYVQNTEACANLANIAAAPANTASVTYTQTKNFTCVSNQRRGYWAEARVGRLQQKGDWQVGYTRIYIEREAVLSNFNYSDIRQGSNVTQHRIDGFYQFDRSVQLGAAALIGRPLATNEPWLTRLQFDAIYIF
jgi:Putative porin